MGYPFPKLSPPQMGQTLKLKQVYLYPLIQPLKSFDPRKLPTMHTGPSNNALELHIAQLKEETIASENFMPALSAQSQAGQNLSKILPPRLKFLSLKSVPIRMLLYVSVERDNYYYSNAN